MRTKRCGDHRMHSTQLNCGVLIFIVATSSSFWFFSEWMNHEFPLQIMSVGQVTAYTYIWALKPCSVDLIGLPNFGQFGHRGLHLVQGYAGIFFFQKHGYCASSLLQRRVFARLTGVLFWFGSRWKPFGVVRFNASFRISWDGGAFSPYLAVYEHFWPLLVTRSFLGRYALRADQFLIFRDRFDSACESWARIAVEVICDKIFSRISSSTGLES